MAYPNQIHHISLDDWASASALINQGFSQNQILQLLGTELPLWDKALRDWNQLMEQNTEVATRYGAVYANPFIGKFQHLKPQENAAKTHQITPDVDDYYRIFCHYEEVQKHGIDFLTAIEEHHQLQWQEWFNIIITFLNYETKILQNGTPAEQEKLQQQSQESKAKWDAYWQDFYKNKNLNLTQDINF